MWYQPPNCLIGHSNGFIRGGIWKRSEFGGYPKPATQRSQRLYNIAFEGDFRGMVPRWYACDLCVCHIWLLTKHRECSYCVYCLLLEHCVLVTITLVTITLVTITLVTITLVTISLVIITLVTNTLVTVYFLLDTEIRRRFSFLCLPLFIRLPQTLKKPFIQLMKKLRMIANTYHIAGDFWGRKSFANFEVLWLFASACAESACYVTITCLIMW